MTTQEFTLVIDHRLTDDEIDALYGGRCDDAVVERSGTEDRSLIHFDRDAVTLIHALQSAILDVTAAGLTIVGVQAPDTMVAA